jgi:hypothetical protein
MTSILANLARRVSPLLASLLPAAGAAAQVSGTVLDPVTSSPIGGALVTLQATSNRTTTAADGSFLLPGVTGAGQVIVAAKKGYYNEGVTVTAPAAGIVLALQAVVVANDPGYAFMEPSLCGICHPDQESDWQGSAMSKAGTNTWVYDVYDGTGSPGGLGGFVYTLDSIHAAANPASECASCHQPEPWVAAPYSPLEPIGSLSAGALHGVSCEICHKIADLDETKTNFPGIWPGVVTLNRPSFPLMMHQVQYGRLGDATFVAPGLMKPSYQPQLAGAACASCHQDKNDPDGDGNFEEPNGVVSEPTWEEWLSSPYSEPSSPFYATCVDCHMPPSGANTVCSVSPILRDPQTVRSHRIEGTTPLFLENAVELSLSVVPAPTKLDVTVRIENTLTGHHVPTGVTVRNMILLVEAWRVGDGMKLVLLGGQRIHALGGVGDPAQGYFAGLPGKLYAKHNVDGSGAGPVFYTEATGILWDNRIAAFEGDKTEYSFAIPPAGGTFRVRARLLYRRSFRALVDAKGWTTTGHGAPLEDIAPPAFGHLMEEAVWTSAGPGPVVPFGGACGNLVAGAAGEPAIGTSAFSLTLSGAVPTVPAAFLVGRSDATWGGISLPLDLTALGAPGCALLVAPEFVFGATTDAGGGAALSFSIPFAPALAGSAAFAQWMAMDPTIPLGWAFSSGLRLTVQP